jgi:hypothetical protein
MELEIHQRKRKVRSSVAIVVHEPSPNRDARAAV